jgi:hypothetical protein
VLSRQLTNVTAHPSAVRACESETGTRERKKDCPLLSSLESLPVLARILESCSVSAMSNGGWLKAIIAGALLWIAISLVVVGHQPANARSAVATIEIVLAVIVAIIACLMLRWR